MGLSGTFALEACKPPGPGDINVHTFVGRPLGWLNQAPQAGLLRQLTFVLLPCRRKSKIQGFVKLVTPDDSPLGCRPAASPHGGPPEHLYLVFPCRQQSLGSGPPLVDRSTCRPCKDPISDATTL